MRGLRLAALLPLLLAAALATPPAAGQEAHMRPLYFLDDPAGDQAYDRGTLIVEGVNDEAFDDVDLLNLSLSEDEFSTALHLTVRFTADVVAASTTTLTFTTAPGPTSLPGSTANGQAFTLNVTGAGATSGIANATATASGPSLAIRLPLASLGVVGGDLLSGLRITSTRTDTGDVPAPLDDDQSGTDQMPDAGLTAPDFTFFRPAPQGDLTLTLLAVGSSTGNRTTVRTADATVTVRYSVQNNGLDDDQFSTSFASDPPLADGPVFAAVLEPLAAGAFVHKTLNLSLDGMPEGVISFTLQVTSERGGSATAQGRITIDLPSPPSPPSPSPPAPPGSPPPPPAERDVVPAKLDFLSPGAEALGFDKAFGRFAEAALLALLVLLAILAVFLALMLGRSTFDNAAADEAPPLTDAGTGAVPPAADEPGDTAPEAMQAALAPAPPAPVVPPPAPAPTPLAIESIVHEPAQPQAGQAVETTVTLRNGQPSSKAVRVQLSVDGKDLAEQQALIPARSSKSVHLPWTAGEGDNRVRVRVLPL